MIKNIVFLAIIIINIFVCFYVGSTQIKPNVKELQSNQSTLATKVSKYEVVNITNSSLELNIDYLNNSLTNLNDEMAYINPYLTELNNYKTQLLSFKQDNSTLLSLDYSIFNANYDKTRVDSLERQSYFNTALSDVLSDIGPAWLGFLAKGVASNTKTDNEKIYAITVKYNEILSQDINDTYMSLNDSLNNIKSRYNSIQNIIDTSENGQSIVLNLDLLNKSTNKDVSSYILSDDINNIIKCANILSLKLNLISEIYEYLLADSDKKSSYISSLTNQITTFDDLSSQYCTVENQLDEEERNSIIINYLDTYSSIIEETAPTRSNLGIAKRGASNYNAEYYYYIYDNDSRYRGTLWYKEQNYNCNYYYDTNVNIFKINSDYGSAYFYQGQFIRFDETLLNHRYYKTTQDRWLDFANKIAYCFDMSGTDLSQSSPNRIS